MNTAEIKHEAVELLKMLISKPSYSEQEDETARLIFDALNKQGFHPHRKMNNVWAVAGEIDEQKPTILLNSHHDTVKAGSSWTYDPFTPTLEGDKLTGLGANDAGGPLVSLFAAFTFLGREEREYNLIFAATAEEENSGLNGIRAILDELGPVDLAIVGEPTQMQMAIAEKGLVVLDCVSHGKTGHAARNEGENALYKAMKVIEWFRTYEFPEQSEVLGSVHMCVTQIQAGSQHNVVPDRCEFVVDVRTTDAYSNEQAVEHIREKVDCEVNPRSLNLNASGIPVDHPIVKKGVELGLGYFGSATMSDQVHMNFPSLKIGPGDTKRSHTPDEYILLSEIEDGIDTYIKLLKGFRLHG